MYTVFIQVNPNKLKGPIFTSRSYSVCCLVIYEQFQGVKIDKLLIFPCSGPELKIVNQKTHTF